MGFEMQLVQIVGAAFYDFLRRHLFDKKVNLVPKNRGMVFEILISGQSAVMIQALNDAVKAEFEPIVLAAIQVSLIDEEIDRAVSLLTKETQLVCRYAKEESKFRLIYDFSCLGKN